MKTSETTNQPFAIVPQALLEDPSITPTDKVILSYLLGKYLTKRDNGEPWTFSCPSIAHGTGMRIRNVQYRVEHLRKHGVLKLYGSIISNKKRCDVFVFVPKAFQTLISTGAKIAPVIANVDKGFDAVGKHQAQTTGANVAPDIASKKKMIEGRSEKEDDHNNNKAPAFFSSAVPELGFGEWCILQGLDLTHLNQQEKENAFKRYGLYRPSRATATRDANKAEDLAEQFERFFYAQ